MLVQSLLISELNLKHGKAKLLVGPENLYFKQHLSDCFCVLKFESHCPEIRRLTS